MQEKFVSTGNFSERLKFALEKRGLKATPTAKKLGISSGYLSDLLNGVKNNPSLETLRKLSRELRCSISWLENGAGEFESFPVFEKEECSTEPNKPTVRETTYPPYAGQSSVVREEPVRYGGFDYRAIFLKFAETASLPEILQRLEELSEQAANGDVLAAQTIRVTIPILKRRIGEPPNEPSP